MSQVPLAPPPPTGGPLDSWLYLLWRRLTATGQMLWSSIVPGSSADVAAVVTDETGSPGSLVFSGNPTLQGVTVAGDCYVGDTTALTGITALGLVVSTNEAVGNNITLRKSSGVSAGNQANMAFARSRGTNAAPTTILNGDSIGSFSAYGYDGNSYSFVGQVTMQCEGTVSDEITPGRMIFYVADSAGIFYEGMRITGNTKVVTLGGDSTAPALKVTPVASQARWIEVTGATSSGNPTVGVSGGILAISASVAITGVVSTSGYTVATLPAGTVGQRAYVTDALAPAYGVAVAGAGAVTIPVFYNGAAWICA